MSIIMKRKHLTSTRPRVTSSKQVTVIILIVFVVLLGLIALKLLRTPSQESRIPASKIPRGDTIEISGVKVKDFTKGAENAAEQSYFTLSRTKDYHIFYIPEQTVFIVSILSYPFDTYRQIAESDLLDKLDIGKSEACKLIVDITTPGFANPDKAGKTFDLSFCSKP